MVNTVDCSARGSIPTKGMFSEKYLRLELSHVQMHGYQESPKANQIKVRKATIKRCPVYLKTSRLNVKDLTIKMATSMMVTPTTSIAYYRGVTAYQ